MMNEHAGDPVNHSIGHRDSNEAPFASEKELQSWLESELRGADGLLDLISNHEDYDFESGKNEAGQRLAQSYEACLSSLAVNQPLAFDENISIGQSMILRPDALLFASESQSLVIVELKNSAKATRESGTELSAYSAAIRAYVPSLPDADIVLVIVSNDWPTLLRQYVLNEVYWGHRSVLCLQPVRIENRVRLHIVSHDTFSDGLEPTQVSPHHLGGLHVCLEDYSSRDPARLDDYLPNMKAAMHAIAIEASAQRGHGFCILSKLDGPTKVAPYCITIVQFAPFRMLERLLGTEVGTRSMFRRLAEVVREEDPTGQSHSFMALVETCQNYVKEWSHPTMESFNDYAVLRKELPKEGIRYFQAWGVFGKQFVELQSREAAQGIINLEESVPRLGLEVLQSIISDDYEFVDLGLVDF